jgi:uncharacterized membrane protein YgdD (TMEM256/DUF423 family)
MAQIFLAIAAILGAVSVGFGAFGAHALREWVSDCALEIFEIVRSRLSCSLALRILVNVWLSENPSLGSAWQAPGD